MQRSRNSTIAQVAQPTLDRADLTREPRRQRRHRGREWAAILPRGSARRTGQADAKILGGMVETVMRSPLVRPGGGDRMAQDRSKKTGSAPWRPRQSRLPSKLLLGSRAEALNPGARNSTAAAI